MGGESEENRVSISPITSFSALTNLSFLVVSGDLQDNKLHPLLYACCVLSEFVKCKEKIQAVVCGDDDAVTLLSRGGKVLCVDTTCTYIPK